MSENQGKGRVTLKTYFEADKMPREGHFADLIDASLNKIDDQLFISVEGEGENSARFVGIGSTDPQSPLSIRNRTGEARLLGFEDTGGSEEWHISINPDGAANGLQVVSNNNPNATLMMEADGNVGIGTNDPVEKLDVNGNVRIANGNLNLTAGNADIAGSLIVNGNTGIGMANPQDKLHVEGHIRASGNISAQNFDGNISWNNVTEKPNSLIPTGVIVMWSGSVGNIPAGWVLCNGSNGAPDLSGRFVVGVGNGYNPGNKGGLSHVTLNINQMPNHNHRLKDGEGGKYTNSLLGDKGGSPCLSGQNHGTKFVNQTTGNLLMTKTGGNQPHENRPPYYALCYIIKL